MERDTLKAMYRLGVDEARTGDIAGALGLSPAAVTARVKRLAERGLVEHTRYRGVALTAAGKRAAVASIRRHRIVERFLADMLGYPWNEADRLAGSFEGALPEEVEERLFRALDRPSTCPHGFPIPDAGSTEVAELPTLHTLETGETAVIALPGSTDPDVVAFLDTLGLRPGVGVAVREKHPFDGPLVLRVGKQDRTIGANLARQIYVRRDRRRTA